MKIANDACIGCGLCSLGCPKQCIVMKTNSQGYLQPSVDADKCVRCGICEKKCPQNQYGNFVEPYKCFVAWSKDEEDRKKSASGGIASVIARYQLQNEGLFFGCDYDPQGNLRHFSIKEQEDLESVRTSKYSQSSAYLSFKEIKKTLDERKEVVFLGTPCQVAALTSYVGQKANLVTIDLVCHGTPPTYYLQEHLKEQGIYPPYQKIRFRGEYDQMLTVWKDGEIVYQKDRWDDAYFTAFYKNMISYDACYNCKYAGPKRVADITIGDFWGLGELKTLSKLTSRPSLILINTEKGEKIFEEISGELFYEERPVIEGINGNGRLMKPPGKNEAAQLFQNNYRLGETSFGKTVKNTIKKTETVAHRKKIVYNVKVFISRCLSAIKNTFKKK